jgi:4-hydroxy-tetrahydrodipicolinate reductase
MRIALIGYGKMGKAIEGIALSRGHEIVLKIGIENIEENTVENIRQADVAIEFTGPDSAFNNIMQCLSAGVPVVSGSTGWLKNLSTVQEFAGKNGSAFLYASNFSVGVNIFFELNRRLADLMAPQTDYDVRISEIHHTEKKDAPSGTAISLAEQVLEKIRRKTVWVNHNSSTLDDLVIESKRIDPAPGTHIVKYNSMVDEIEIVHTAHNRQGFAAGAVLAAEFVRDKKGIFHMSDVLGF